MYSHLSHLNSTGRYDEGVDLMSRTIRLLLYLVVPVTAILIELRFPLVRLLFQRGQFDAASTFGTAQCLLIYAIGLGTFALEGLFVYCFYAMSNTRTPITVGIVFVIVDMVLAAALLRRFESLGIVGAFVIAKTAKVLVLGWLLNRKLGKRMWGQEIGIFAAKLVACGGMMWVVLRLLAEVVPSGEGFVDGLIGILILLSCGVAVYGLASRAFRIEEGIATLRMARSAIAHAWSKRMYRRP